MRAEYAEQECQKDLHLAEIAFLDRYPVRVIDSWVPAWSACEGVLKRLGYRHAIVVGSYNCRDIADTTVRSLHAYKLAVDIEPQDNWVQRDRRGQGTDWSRCKITKQQCQAIEAIRFRNGEQAFRTGALSFNTPDPMHISCAASKAAVASGIDWATVEVDEMWANDFTDRTWMFMFHSGVPGIRGYGRYYCSDDGSYSWEEDPKEGLNAPWGSNPHAPTNDGDADYDEKLNAINYLLAGFSEAAGRY